MERKSDINKVFKIMREANGGDLFKGFDGRYDWMFLEKALEVAKREKAKIYKSHVLKAFKKHFERLREKETVDGLNFAKLKEVAQKVCLTGRVVDSEYTLNVKEDILGYLKCVARMDGNVLKMIQEYEDFDYNGWGEFLKFNVLATGGGYFIAEQFWYAQKGSRLWSTKRRNYFFCGWTDRNYFFAQSVSGQLVWSALKQKKWWDYFIRKFTNDADIWRGRVCLKKVRGREIIQKLERVDGEIQVGEWVVYHTGAYRFLKDDDRFVYHAIVEGPGRMVHLGGKHKEVEIPKGFFYLYEIREREVWDFKR